ncbi:MAG: acetyl-CoA carboxylase biotin carboxyl carrier protein [Rhodospirillales bacterium]
MARFDVNTDLVRRLAELLNETGLSELEYQAGDQRIRLSRAAPVAATTVSVAASPVAVAEPAAAAAERHPGTVLSPMVGTVYLAPGPGEPKFVSVGATVTAGQTVCLIEAMKTYNPVRAPHGGTVTRLLVEDGEPVEFGAELMVIE